MESAGACVRCGRILDPRAGACASCRRRRRARLALVPLGLAACALVSMARPDPGGPSPSPVARVPTAPVSLEGGEVSLIAAGTWPGDERRPPPPGRVFLGVRVRYRAISDERFLSPGAFDAVSADGTPGEKLDAGPPDWSPRLRSSRLRAGQSIEGWLVFSVPGGRVVRLSYDESVLDEAPDAVWQLGL